MLFECSYYVLAGIIIIDEYKVILVLFNIFLLAE